MDFEDKNTQEEEIVEEVFDDELDSVKSFSTESPAKNKMFKFMGIILGVVILLLLILFIVSNLSPKKYTYTEIEGILENAAREYFKDYPTNLPKDEGSIVEIDSSNLTEAEKMKELSAYTGEEVACSGKVQVEKSGNLYLYTPFLSCGDVYTTTELTKKVLENNPTVTAGYGLYSNNGTYTFRGEKLNNYVKLDRGLWRIVKITSNNNLVLVSDLGTDFGHPWDDRYNESKEYDSGINQYGVSRMREFLNKLYTNPSHDAEDGEYLLSKKDRAKLVYFNLCIGKRGIKSEGNNNALECSEVFKNQKIGLLTLSEYMYASLDPNCKTSESTSCKNYNYLNELNDWWLITADKDSNSQVFNINRHGNITSEDAAGFAIVRPVIYLNSKVLYKSGNGTKEKPYKVK